MKGRFQYSSPAVGIEKISRKRSGWGTGFADFDNDGWKDLFVAGSHVMDNIETAQPGLHYLEPPSILTDFGRVQAFAHSEFELAALRNIT